MTEIESQGL